MIITIFGCNNSSTEQKLNEVKAVVVKTEIKKVIKEEQLAMKKDPVCGMPVWKYLENTTLYDGKIYGFCGKGCKDEFMKKPDNFIH